MQVSFIARLFALLLIAGCIAVACSSDATQNRKAQFTDEGYDLNRPQVVKLPDKLNEISGLSFYPKDSSLFAIIDEAGVLFKIILKQDDQPEVQHWRFSKHGDYEDLVLLDSTFYIMESKGNLVAVRFTNVNSVDVKEYSIPVEGKNEFEILYYDAAIKKLVLICKDCAADNKRKVSTWAFDPKSREYNEGPYTIDAAVIAAANESTAKQKFKPSAAAIHPVTGDLYIVSSVNKCLVISDTKGAVKKVYPLDADLYKQPEGIAFTPSGDMFISNEAADQGLPNILYFKYKKTVHEN